MKRKETAKKVSDATAEKGDIKKEEVQEVRKSMFALWWENHEPSIEIVDMRAILK
jgi:predicted glycosyltransferase